MYITIPPKTVKRYSVIVHYKYFKRLPLLITTATISTDVKPLRFKSKRELMQHIENQVMNTYREYDYNACVIDIEEKEY